MRRARRIGWLGLALLWLAPAVALAQAALPAPAIVVVDMMQIMRDAKAAKDVQAQVQAEMNAYTKEVSAREEDLKRLSDQLERQRSALAPEVFAAKSQEYQQRYTALDHDVQTTRQAMQQTYSEAMTRVETMALQIVADVAKERKANMVVAKAALLYMADGIDVTAEVTQRLDEKLPTMAVNAAKEGGEAAKPQGKK
jgi:Skp family chaperone for outer membrane proteins